MGMGGGGKQSTTETKEVRLPPWVEAASQENYERAKQVANRPYAAYGGPTVAPLDSQTGWVRSHLGDLNDYYGNYKTGTAGLQGVLDYNPNAIKASSVNATMLPGMDRAAYTNPWITDVENRAVDAATRAGQQRQVQLAADAASKGAFGGSRQAVQQGVADAETIRGIGDLSAGLREKGFDTATQAMQADAARKQAAETQTGQWGMDAQTAYEANKIAANQQRVAAAAGQADIADRAQAAQMNEMATRLGVGNLYQQQKQRVYDDKKGKWQEKRNYPLEQLNILLASLGMSPYGHSETSTSTSSGGGGGGGLGQALGMGGSLLQMFAGLSDIEEKTDIKVVGKHPSLPVKVYAYRYKGDPKTYPKVVGPMAHEIEKVAPHLVHKIGKRRVVDMRALAV